MSKDRCALFNHGRNAVYLYRNAASVAEAQAEIKFCDDQIKALFPGYVVELMVPHQNSWGPKFIQAVRNVGYLAVSASTESYSNMPYDLTARPIQIPQQTTTADYAADGSWIPLAPSKTFSVCQAADARGEDCVIMIHPHEFSAGVYTFTMLTQLINLFKTNGWINVNFHTIIAEQLGGTTGGTVAPSLRPSTVHSRTPTKIPTRTPSRLAGTTTSAPSFLRTATPSIRPTTPNAQPQQQAAWGKCAGIGWTGPTTCIAGYYCEYQSEWYSQCVPIQ